MSPVTITSEVGEVVAMGKQTERDLPTLLGDALRDSGRLARQQVEILRSEIKEGAGQVGRSVGSVAAGGGLLAAGTLLSGMMLAHLLHRCTRIPLWGCYGVVGGAISASGVSLVATGMNGLAKVGGLPETTAALTENLAWLKDQVTPTV